MLYLFSSMPQQWQPAGAHCYVAATSHVAMHVRPCVLSSQQQLHHTLQPQQGECMSVVL